jgi:hypothetical protein
VLQRFKEDKSILQITKIRTANWICCILRINLLLKHVTEGKIDGRIEVTKRRGRRSKQLLDELKENKGY